MTSLARSASSEPPPWAPHPLRDSCGRQCHHITLPDLLDAAAAAALMVAPDRCVILDALPDVLWTEAGVRTLAYRVAGRVPLLWDGLPPRLGDAFTQAVREVLDWARADVA